MQPWRDEPAPAGQIPSGRSHVILWLCVLSLAMLAAGGFLIRSIRRSAARPLAGYEFDVAVLEHEYRNFYGKLMRDADAERLFEQAAEQVKQREYQPAIDLMQSVSKEAAVPVVFNDLGVLLAETGDRPHAAAAFREALARNSNYGLVLRNLSRLGGFTVDAAKPVAVEAEPNNSSGNANLIALGTDISAEIADGTDDLDYFRFISPAAPRDHVAIEIEPRTPVLELGMRLYDGHGALVLDRRPLPPGGRIAEYLSATPNTTWYVEIFGGHTSAGEYTLRVSAMHAFDDYEPNDDIFSPTSIAVGSAVQANIMDAEDTDFYTFESPRTGTITIDVTNRSQTLIPALTTFGPDRRTIGFGPDVRKPGESLHHTMEVQAHQVYFVQIWSQGRTSGDYTLHIQ